MSKNFALVGAAGYIAPRHLMAIKDTGNRLVAVVDPNDSVGILDRYFHDVSYFREFERFDRHVEKLKFSNSPEAIDYVSICSPNHLHDAHIRFGLRIGANVICEKPLVINPWNIDYLKELESQYEGNVNTVLQLRVHPSIIALKEKIDNGPKDKTYDIDLTYLTSRGPWYHYSWKGDENKSGGLATNIGVHFFDMLSWIFGSVEKIEVHASSDKLMSGFLALERARIKWILSVDRNLVPKEYTDKGQYTYRSIKVDNEEVEFSGGFTDLHTVVYQEILKGNGYGLDDARNAIKIVHDIRKADIIGKNSQSHPLLQ
ncbi:MAG: Gfo/Idh/MocA family oxidoreductase [Bdellovibrionota bacterium]|nr:Gfo/Idh/MocA family oxidoreductase [Bdellovibrionota bacterium]MEC8624739.1 Gfo/Idh/MocA family oxidoreductase [Bdellovibrionota bacterium]